MVAPGPDDVVIELAGQADAEPAAAVHRASSLLAYADIFPVSSPPPTLAALSERWAELIADPAASVLVARRRRTVVGAAALAPDPDVPTGLLLALLYVHPDRWGRGVGGRLHDHIVELARSTGRPGCNLWVLEANRPARSLYERRGWRLIPGRHLVNRPSGVVDVLYQLDF